MVVRIAPGILLLLIFSIQNHGGNMMIQTGTISNLKSTINSWIYDLEIAFEPAQSSLVSERELQIAKVEIAAKTVVKSYLIRSVDLAEKAGLNISTCLFDGNEVTADAYLRSMRDVQKCFNDDLDYMRFQFHKLHAEAASLIKKVDTVHAPCQSGKNSLNEDAYCMDKNIGDASDEFRILKNGAAGFFTFMSAPLTEAKRCSATIHLLFAKALRDSAGNTLACINSETTRQKNLSS